MNKGWIASSLSIVLAGLMTSAVSAQEQPTIKDDGYRHLMLAGGGLTLCTSMASDSCNETDWIDSKTMRTNRYIDLSEKSIKTAVSDEYWTGFREEARKKVDEALKLIYDRMNEEIITERVFMREFTRRATLKTYNSLSEAEWNKLVDLLEMPVPAELDEKINLNESQNKPAIDIYRQFVEMAKTTRFDDSKKPVVFFTTSSSRDPYNEVDYYMDLFSQLGAEPHWFPVDAALIKAQQEGRCDELADVQEEVLGAYARDRVYRDRYQQQVEFCKAPKEALKMVRQANAIFINDGDANLTRSTFINEDNQPSDLLRDIVSFVQSKRLVVGGNGAGAVALTSKPMISNGTTESAIKDGAFASEPPPFGCDLDATCPTNTNPDTLTFHPLGGLGLFHFGILDSDFSDKGRYGRLIRLAGDSGTPLSLGIDENTAMKVNLEKGLFDIVGERGVFFVENAQSVPTAVASTFHYLVAGASGMMNPYGLQTAEFSDQSGIVKENPTTNFLTDRGLVDSIRVLCGEERNEVTLLNKDYRLIARINDASRTAEAGGECQVINGKIGIAYQPEEKL
ncbi:MULTISPECIES: cyanophycinase [Idiomarina]|nr:MULTISPECIES: cyanophycinase [Idiomarina]MBL74601.1 cyanophycinase [Idiomarinaceae bacterium]|tara:strand:- start:567 stop:2264 length:1698 start_codon:yes stop_codon:yes gene_type:complete